MTTRAATFAETIEILWDIISLEKDEALAKIKSVGLSYTKTLIWVLVLWAGSTFFLIYLKAATGMKIFAFLAAIASLLLAVVMRALWFPISTCLSMMAQETVNPAKASEGYIKRSALFVLAGLSASLYAINNPIENNPDLLMSLGIAFVALLILVYVAGAVIPINVYTVILGVYIIYTTLLFRTDEPAAYLMNGCNPLHTTYQGQIYGPYESVAVTHSIGQFSDLVILGGKYDIIFTEWADILPEGSKKPIRITKRNNKNISSSKIRIRTDSGLAMLIPLKE